MKRREFVGSLAGGAGAAAALGLPLNAAAQEKVIKIGLAEDFTAVYTFASIEYAQGQQDYLALVNARGGVKGYKFQAQVVDTGNQPQRGIEAYERFKTEGVMLVDFLSTPVSRAVVPRALKDNIPVITMFHGRSDAADGQTFPYIFPMTPLYWSQAAHLIQYINVQEKGSLKGKKIALVHIDSPFGKEPIQLLRALAAKHEFELGLFPYPTPGNEQSSTWSAVRRFQPDWTLLWGAGTPQSVALREALRNGLPMDRVASVIWMSETETGIVGPDKVKGLLRFEGVAHGKDQPIIQAIQKEVIAKGKGSGKPEKVGSTYYNIGVASMALVVQGAKLALESSSDPLTPARLKAGLERITNYEGEGLLPPTTVTPKDHQGGGAGRIAQWDGQKWVPKTGWFASGQDLVWELVQKNAEEFKASGK
jgi:branched-chain amino acid transport system substrate-binding protein